MRIVPFAKAGRNGPEAPRLSAQGARVEGPEPLPPRPRPRPPAPQPQPCARGDASARLAAARCMCMPAVPRYNRGVQAGSLPKRGITHELPHRAAAYRSGDRTGARRIDRSRRVRHRPAAGPGPASGGRHRRVRRDVQLPVRSERRQALRPGVSRDVASSRPAEDRPRSGHPHGTGGDGAGPGHGDGAQRGEDAAGGSGCALVLRRAPGPQA